MNDDRIPTHIFLMAHVRRFLAEGMPTVILHKGDPGGGLIIAKLMRMDTSAGFGFAERQEPLCRVLTQTRDLEGRPAWFAARDGVFMPESEANSYIERAVQRDPDLWAVEVETSDGENPFDGRVI
jgi:hypothetical protein